MKENRQYRPSNSDDGFWFIDKFCKNCIHGKYKHTQEVGDKPCEILSRSFFAEAVEWIYDADNEPTCTAFKKFTWVDQFNNLVDNPPTPYPPDPNQLTLNF